MDLVSIAVFILIVICVAVFIAAIMPQKRPKDRGWK
jgi:hypothetical protein